MFRVYIEDRSEPGGYHPKGAVEPADIYCFQAWNTGIVVNNKTTDPNNLGTSSLLGDVNAFRTAVANANCAFLNSLQNDTTGKLIGSLPSGTVNGVNAFVNDCGPMYSGNHQIHPSTSATCSP